MARESLPTGIRRVTGHLFQASAECRCQIWTQTGIYPHGQKFGFGLYSVVGNSKVDPTTSNMHRVAANGFTLAGPYYDTNWRNFSNIYAAANEGLKIYISNSPTRLARRCIGRRSTGGGYDKPDAMPKWPPASASK